MLFVLNNKTIFEKKVNKNGLAYNENATLGEIVNADSDGDSIPDWEEGLWGTDPNKKETTPGIPDGVVVQKLKNEQELLNGNNNIGDTNTEKLTQTDKFSRELFSTVTALTQNGDLDQTTVDQISGSLAEKIKNPVISKIYLLSDLKISPDISVQEIKTYDKNVSSISKKYPKGETVIDILKDFVVDENNVDTTVLVRLNPIKNEVKGIINELVKTPTPQSLSKEHLNVINSLERLYENINNIQLFDTDVVVSLGAISQYQNNTDLLEKSITELNNKINLKLNN